MLRHRIQTKLIRCIAHPLSLPLPTTVTKVYQDANTSLYYPASTEKLTELFLDAGIKPLEYMKEVPKQYLDHSKITAVEIPNNITSIGDYAFRDCNGLTSIDIPDSVTSIGYQAFYSCDGLTSIIIPDSVTTIGKGSFNNCSSLTSITIPGNVTKIGKKLFNGCTNLTNITFAGTKAQWEAIEKENDWNYGMSTNTIHCSDGDFSW